MSGLTIHEGAHWVLPSIKKISDHDNRIADWIKKSMPVMRTVWVDAYTQKEGK